MRPTRQPPSLPPLPAGRGLEAAGAGLSLLWLLLVLSDVFLGGETRGFFGWILVLLMAMLPVALIWGMIVTLRSVHGLRDEAARLQATLETMRAAPVPAQIPAQVRPAARAEDPPAARQNRTTMARPQSETPTEQPALALEPEEVPPPLSIADFIRALQFPESSEDKEGFRALRLALADRTVAKLIRAAQDVLTLLSQDGIYMDDMPPEPCPPELWRRFAAGERGKAIAAVGGIREEAALALTAARMKSDPVFRDAAHHFLRTFDRTFAAAEPDATDAEVAELADTRTARAFMLFGRVTGTFD